jgi:hypothetical protein
VAGLTAALGAGIGLYARYVEDATCESTESSLVLPRWPAGLEGFRLAFVADFHVGHKPGGPWATPALPAAIDAVRIAKPDLLVFGGDFGFMRWQPEELASAAALFDVPVRVGVLGNHDFARGSRRARALRGSLEARGFIVLENESVCLRFRDTPVWVAGLGDGATKRADMPKLVASLPGDAQPVLLVSHTPDAVTDMPAGVFDLVLAGHTHGGQIALPFLNHVVLRVWAKTRYDRGLYDVGDVPMFVTKGLGMVGHHARFRAKPEIALLTLRSSPPPMGV